MKKHILGLAIFGSIIFAAVLFKAAFSTETNSTPVVGIEYSTPRRTSCFTRKIRTPDQRTLVVKQAVLNLDTKQFSWEIFAPVSSKPVALHLFAKTADGDAYLVATEIVPAAVSGRLLKYSTSYASLENYNGADNLYVVPETTSPETVNTMYFDAKFDENSAVPVTIYTNR